MHPTNAMRVGFVGAGRLGLPMVERLEAAGHDLVVHARRPETQQRLASLGVPTTDALSDAVIDRELLLVCVYSDDQLIEVTGTVAPRMPRGAVLASHVTGRVSTLTSLAARFPEIGFVDAPLSGTADDIRAGTLTVLLGGAVSDRTTADQAIATYSDTVIHTGRLGTALAAKLVNNALLAAHVQLVAEAARIGAAFGVNEPALLAALEHMSGGSTAASMALRRGGVGALADAARPFLVKDVAACLDQAEAAGIDLDLLIDVVRRGAHDLT